MKEASCISVSLAVLPRDVTEAAVSAVMTLPHVTVMLVTFAEPTLPEPLLTAQSCVGLVGCVAMVIA
jgi:hypothetical protein